MAGESKSSALQDVVLPDRPVGQVEPAVADRVEHYMRLRGQAEPVKVNRDLYDKKEFHKAVRALGFDVSSTDTDAVFESLELPYADVRVRFFAALGAQARVPVHAREQPRRHFPRRRRGPPLDAVEGPLRSCPRGLHARE